MSGNDGSFEVNDRRKTRLDDAPPEASGGREEAVREGRADDAGQPQTIDFVSFVGSLAATALMHMGEKLAPGQPELPVDLPAAKQMIDLMELLKVKTKGNLDKEESDALDALLYNLRMRYVSKTAGK